MDSTRTEKKSRCSRKTVIVTLVVLLLAGGLAGGLAYWLTRPENIPITEAQANARSLPSLVQASANGAVRIDSSTLLADPSNVTYHLTIGNATLESFMGNALAALFLVPNLDAVDFEAVDENFVVPSITSLDFPHDLPATFNPSKYEGGVFATSDEFEVLDDSFEWTFDETQSMVTTEDEGEAPTTASEPVMSTEASDMVGSTTDAPATADSGEGATTETNGAVSPTVAATSSPTKAPTAAPVETPVVLFAELSGSYGVGGTITLQYRRDIGADGNIVNIPFLLFENIAAPSAPGPFLWISRRPNQFFSSIANEDIYLPLDTSDESFTKSGTYTLDFPTQDVDFTEFIGGSYIVWCDPFSVYIGGGAIVEQ